jgi:predicted MFS family arabinose efflux permease
MMVVRDRRSVQLVLLALAMGLAGYVRTAMSPLQETMRAALSLTDNQVALLQGPVIGIPVLLAAIPLGLLIDRCSRACILWTLVALSLCGSLLTAFASSFGMLLFARGLAGTAALAILPVVFSLLADLYPPAQRGMATTLAIVGQVAGNSAAFALGGVLLTMTDRWESAMLWLVVPLLPIFFLTAALREPERIRSSDASSTDDVLHRLKRNRSTLVPLALGIMLAEIAIGAVIIWAAPMLARRFALPPDQVGSIMGATMLASGLLGPVVGGVLADYCQRTGGPRRTISALAVLALISAPMSLFAFTSSVTVTSVLLVTAATLTFAIVVMGMALFSIVISEEVRGLGMAVLVAAEVLFALAVAPPAVSVLSSAMGGPERIGDALSIVCVVIGLIAAATFAWGRKYFPVATSVSADQTDFRENVARAD